MKTDLIHSLTEDFESFAHRTDSGIEFWLARDLQHLLGYAQWRNFNLVVSKAKTACEISGHEISDHFADVGKMVDLGSGSTREIDDLMLTRFACYLIAQNGNPSKNQIAFAVQTRRAKPVELPRQERDHFPSIRKMVRIKSRKMKKSELRYEIALRS